MKKAVRVLYPGTRVAVIGAGGLGHIGIQCLRAMTAAEIIVLDPSKPALELARGWGADHLVRVGDSHVNTVLELTGGEGGDVVIDFVGEKGAVEDRSRSSETAATTTSSATDRI